MADDYDDDGFGDGFDEAATPAGAKKSKRKSGPTGTPLERCADILAALLKRADAGWFEDPVPADTDGYFEMITHPMDYGTISGKLKGGAYADETAFVADVRLVVANAVAYSPDPENDCNQAARAYLAAFEKLLLKNELATDGGAAVAAAEEAARRKRHRVA